MLYNHRTRAFGHLRTWKGQDGKTYSDTHKGDDFAETFGNDPVPAIQPGKVIARGHSRTFGYYLWVRRDSRLVVKYHMFRDHPPYAVGTPISPGQILGLTGASADNASGEHIHIQTEEGGIPVNPQPYIWEYLGGSIAGGSTSTPIENEVNDMTPAESKLLTDIADMTRNLYAGMFQGGPSMNDNGRSVSTTLGDLVTAVDEIRGVVTQPVVRTIDGIDTPISQIQDNADTNTIVRELRTILGGIPVAQIEPGSPAPVVQLTDYDLDALASRVAAVLSRVRLTAE